MGSLLAISLIVLSGSLFLGHIGHDVPSCAASSLRVLVLRSQQVSSVGMVIVYLTSSLGRSLGGELCF